jgi:hypothetical protein
VYIERNVKIARRELTQLPMPLCDRQLDVSSGLVRAIRQCALNEA